MRKWVLKLVALLAIAFLVLGPTLFGLLGLLFPSTGNTAPNPASSVQASPGVAALQAPNDPRFCGPPKYRKERIERSEAQRSLFVKMFPCPSKRKGAPEPFACSDWQVDHVIPLACGGCDTPVNMQWLPTRMKACKVVLD
jgi:hypothetical protein